VTVCELFSVYLINNSVIRWFSW